MYLSFFSGSYDVTLWCLMYLWQSLSEFRVNGSKSFQREMQNMQNIGLFRNFFVFFWGRLMKPNTK